MKNHCGALLGTTYVTVPSDLLTTLLHPEPLHVNVRFVKQPLSPRLQTSNKIFICIPTPHKATMPIFYSFRLIFYFSGFFFVEKGQNTAERDKRCKLY